MGGWELGNAVLGMPDTVLGVPGCCPGGPWVLTGCPEGPWVLPGYPGGPWVLPWGSLGVSRVSWGSLGVNRGSGGPWVLPWGALRVNRASWGSLGAALGVPGCFHGVLGVPGCCPGGPWVFPGGPGGPWALPWVGLRGALDAATGLGSGVCASVTGGSVGRGTRRTVEEKWGRWGGRGTMGAGGPQVTTAGPHARSSPSGLCVQ